MTAIAAGTLVGMYVVDLAGNLSGPPEPFRWVTVFKYYGIPASPRESTSRAFVGLTLAELRWRLSGQPALRAARRARLVQGGALDQ